MIGSTVLTTSFPMSSGPLTPTSLSLNTVPTPTGWIRFPNLCISTDTLTQAARTIRNLADELSDGKWVALGGGGYAIWQVVPRTWSLVWAVMNDQDPTGALPQSWRDQ